MDIDKEWREKHGAAEQPCEFNARLAAGKLTDEELQAISGCDGPDAAFAALYPDYVSLDAFREAAFTAAAKSLLARDAATAAESEDDAE